MAYEKAFLYLAAILVLLALTPMPNATKSPGEDFADLTRVMYNIDSRGSDLFVLYF